MHYMAESNRQSGAVEKTQLAKRSMFNSAWKETESEYIDVTQV